MLCLTILIILLEALSIKTSNVGSTIFYNKKGKSECWTEDELAKLRARKLFQRMIPPQVTPDRVNEKFIKEAIRFYRGALRFAIQSDPDERNSAIVKQALLDSFGGHLHNMMLPTVRFAYYAGYVRYKHVRQIHDVFETFKTLLNTKGLGWKDPALIPQWSNLTVVKVLIGSGKLNEPCAHLVTKRDSNSCIYLPIPKLDDKQEPSAIALPFKVNGLYSLTSPYSENILLKYYTTAARCLLQSSPENCRHSDFVNFNNELWHWMKRDVAPHLLDEKLYAAYGGVLRVAAAVQSYGKGLSRRNLFEYQSSGVSKWHPWRALSQSYVTVDADWTPSLYVGMVFIAALLICTLQICYNYMFGNENLCNCTGRNKRIWPEEVAYATVDTTIPSMLPTHYTNDKAFNGDKQSANQSKSSRGSVLTQRVYDFNENTEKIMDIIMSDNEESDTDSPPLSKQTESDEAYSGSGEDKPKHEDLPELQTSVSQLRIQKKPRDGCSSQTYTSTATISGTTCLENRASESIWSGSVSTSSGRSLSSEGSKTVRRSRSSRDLMWARRVLAKLVARSAAHSTTGTELDVNSNITPPLRR